MSNWGNNDNAANSVSFAPAQFKKIANTANRDALYGNTTQDAFVTNQTVGMFAVDSAEIAASKGKIAHTGWVLRTEGTGGRAGRVQTEVLVAGKIVDDGSDDSVYADYSIVIGTQPVDVLESAVTGFTISVSAATLPAGGTLSYQWLESANGNVFVNATTGASDTTTDTLSVSNTTPVDGYFYKVELSTTGGAANVTSEAVTVTVV